MKCRPVVHLRAADPSDDQAVIDLARQCGLSLSPERERGLSHSRLTVAVSELRPERIEGFALVWHLGDEAELIDIGVAPELRRQGTARLLLDEQLKWTASMGAARMFLEVRAKNNAARALYGSFGFEEYGRRARYYSDGEDAILYQCCLSPPD